MGGRLVDRRIKINNNNWKITCSKWQIINVVIYYTLYAHINHAIYLSYAPYHLCTLLPVICHLMCVCVCVYFNPIMFTFHFIFLQAFNIIFLSTKFRLIIIQIRISGTTVFLFFVTLDLIFQIESTSLFDYLANGNVTKAILMICCCR